MGRHCGAGDCALRFAQTSPSRATDAPRLEAPSPLPQERKASPGFLLVSGLERSDRIKGRGRPRAEPAASGAESFPRILARKRFGAQRQKFKESLKTRFFPPQTGR